MMHKTGLIAVAFLIFTSCATKTLWENTDPDGYIKIGFADITEQELIDKKVKYRKSEIFQAYFVEKNSMDRLKDYSLRILLTPATVVIDTGAIVVVAVAYVAIGSILYRSKIDICENYSGCF